MILFDGLGLYVGWEEAPTSLSIYAVRGDLSLSVGHLVLGCEWFHRPRQQLGPMFRLGGSDDDSAAFEEEDRPSDVPAVEGRTVVPPCR